MSPRGTECAPNTLNILFVIHTPKNPHTAVYNRYRQLTEFLERHGHHGTIVAPEDFPNMCRQPPRWFPLIYPFWIARWMARCGKNYDITVFHSYSGWLVQLLRRCVPAYRQTRIVTAFHGLEPIYFDNLREECERTGQPLRLQFRLLHGALMPRLIRIGCLRSDRIFCLNNHEAAYLRQNNWGNPGRISLVSNGVPREFFVDRAYAPHVHRLLFVGQWLGRKGTPYLVQAFTTLASKLPELQLRCVGTMVDEETVRADFPVSIRSRVSVRAQVSRCDLVAEYEQADIFIFPSLMEGFSNALIEAMATGLPIVTTPVGAAPDLFQSELNGLLVATRDPHALVSSVQRLVEDKALRERLGRQAQVTAAKYELESVQKHVVSLLEKTVNGNVRTKKTTDTVRGVARAILKDEPAGVQPPRVSILVPTYNRANYLRDALRSACSQTQDNIEIVVLDDASTDETATVVREFMKDRRVRYVRHDHNLGIAGNWRYGLESARGEYFCLLHDDDTLECDFVANLVEPLENDPELIMAFCDHWVMDSNGRRLPRASRQASHDFKRDLLSAGSVRKLAMAALVHQAVPVGATMFRRRLIVPEFLVQQAQGSIDAWLLYQCVKTGCGAHYVPRRLMNYRIHRGSMTAAAPLSMLQGDLFRYRTILADAHLTFIHGAIRKRLVQTLNKYAHSLLLDARHQESLASVSESLQLKPSLRAVLLGVLASSQRAGTAAVRALYRLRHTSVH